MTDVRSNNTPAAAITGAGAGLGRQIALGFAEKGYRVFGTALSAQEVQDLRQASDGSVRLTIVDVTDDEAVHSWAEQATGELGDHGLDVLISNAGILTPGPLEVLPLQAVRHEFEVNVLGSLAVINAFLPALRRARGRIVQIGSATGKFPLPFNGPSSASKAALEAFADVYRAELKPFGVHFVIVEPGNMATGGPAATARALAEDSRIHDGRAARPLRRRLRRVQRHVQQHAEQRARRRRRSGTGHRGCPATTCAGPRTDRTGRRTTHEGRPRTDRRRARRSPHASRWTGHLGPPRTPMRCPTFAAERMGVAAIAKMACTSWDRARDVTKT